MRFEIRLDRRNQPEPSLDILGPKDRSFFSNFLLARQADRTSDFEFAFGFTAFESCASAAANATGLSSND
jgi:hypothetical protein